MAFNRFYYDRLDFCKKILAQVKTVGEWDKSIPRGYLLRGCEQGTNRVSLPVSIVGISTLLTGWLTPSNIKNLYNNKQISSFLFDFTAFSKNLVCQKLACQKPKQTLTDKNNETNEKLLHDSDKILDVELEGSQHTGFIF